LFYFDFILFTGYTVNKSRTLKKPLKISRLLRCFSAPASVDVYDLRLNLIVWQTEYSSFSESKNNQDNAYVRAPPGSIWNVSPHHQ